MTYLAEVSHIIGQTLYSQQGIMELPVFGPDVEM